MKQQNYYHFIGIDISKLTFDVAISDSQNVKSYMFDNTIKGVNGFLRLLKNQNIELTDNSYLYGTHRRLW